MFIRPYDRFLDEDKLMRLIGEQGEEWACYSAAGVSERYRAALSNSITYVAYEGDILCGYSRSINDCGFYVYVCDVLVRPGNRGRGVGRMLMERVYADHPDTTVYVMSDVDGYYSKLGYRREGSIFEVERPER